MCAKNIHMGTREMSETIWLSECHEKRGRMTMTNAVSPLGTQQTEDSTNLFLEMQGRSPCLLTLHTLLDLSLSFIVLSARDNMRKEP